MKANTKRIVAVVALVAVVLLALLGYNMMKKPASAPAESGSTGGVTGEFTGEAKGMGDVSVTLTLTDGAITGCTAVGEGETQGIGDVALKQLSEDIAATGSIAVDGVTGATITSNAVKEAAAAALTAAGLDPENFKAAAAKPEGGQNAEETDRTSVV